MIVDREQIRAWLAEDVGSGDLTAAIIPPERRARGRVVTREAMVLCGRDGFEAIFAEVDPACRIHWEVAEGEAVAPDTVLCWLEGPARALLTAERTALNFLQTVSATATVTRRYAEAVAGTGAVVLDTRKTIPGLRRWQKYAVEVGGGVNHRMGLYDGILIKENHIAAAGSIAAAVRQARALETGLPVQVEVESLAELEQALEAGAEMILLDNFPLEELRAAVRLNAGRALLEASGNIGLDDIREVALTGVDRISIGALTKHVRAVDLSLRLTLEE